MRSDNIEHFYRFLKVSGIDMTLSIDITLWEELYGLILKKSLQYESRIRSHTFFKEISFLKMPQKKINLPNADIKRHSFLMFITLLSDY